MSNWNTDPCVYLLYYWLGYESAVSDCELRCIQLEEEKTRIRTEYREMCQLVSSYVEKASLELQLVRGEPFCDVAAMKREVAALRESLSLLKQSFSCFSELVQKSMLELQSLLSSSSA